VCRFLLEKIQLEASLITYRSTEFNLWTTKIHFGEKFHRKIVNLDFSRFRLFVVKNEVENQNFHMFYSHLGAKFTIFEGKKPQKIFAARQNTPLKHTFDFCNK